VSHARKAGGPRQSTSEPEPNERPGHRPTARLPRSRRVGHQRPAGLDHDSV